MPTPASSFRPHPFVRGGNAQTLVGVLYPWRKRPYRAKHHLVPLPDGDQLLLHDDRPRQWRPNDPSALLIHGLGGCHASPYVQHSAAKLNAIGVRTFRLDLRGCGAGEKFARGGAHCASWGDVQATLHRLAKVCPFSPVHLVGFSLGGALALNLAGELGEEPCGNMVSVLAICPPIDLHAIDESFRQGAGRVYSRHFCKMMWKQIQRRLREMDDPPEVDVSRVPRHIRELDEQITAPFHGYSSVEEYYDHASAGQRLATIHVPTKIITAADDPVIPIHSLERYPLSDAIEVDVTQAGGHLGFVGRRGDDPDRRWIDWRVVDWIVAQRNRSNRLQRDFNAS